MTNLHNYILTTSMYDEMITNLISSHLFYWDNNTNTAYADLNSYQELLITYDYPAHYVDSYLYKISGKCKYFQFVDNTNHDKSSFICMWNEKRKLYLEE